MNYEKDLLSLFDEILAEEKPIHLTDTEIKERKRLENLYSLSEDNVDEVFDNLFEHQDNKIIGKKINAWTILSYSGKDKGGNILILCQCDCGNKSLVRISLLFRGRSKQCRSCNARRQALNLKEINTNRVPPNKKYFPAVGERFGGRVIVEIKPNDPKGQQFVKCQCDCGKYNILRYTELIIGKSHYCRKCSRNKKHPQTKSFDELVEKLLGKETVEQIEKQAEKEFNGK